MLQWVTSHWKPSVTRSRQLMPGCLLGLKAEGTCRTYTCQSGSPGAQPQPSCFVWIAAELCAVVTLELGFLGLFLVYLFIINNWVWKTSSVFQLLKYIFVVVTGFCHTWGVCSELFKHLLVTLLSCCLTKSSSEDISSLWRAGLSPSLTDFGAGRWFFRFMQKQQMRRIFPSAAGPIWETAVFHCETI